MSSYFFTTPFSNSATSQSGASGSVPARPSDTRISQLKFKFSSTISSIDLCLLRSFESSRKDNKPEWGGKSCLGDSEVERLRATTGSETTHNRPCRMLRSLRSVFGGVLLHRWLSNSPVAPKQLSEDTPTQNYADACPSLSSKSSGHCLGQISKRS